MLTLLLTLGLGCTKDDTTGTDSAEADADTDADTDSDTDSDSDSDTDADADADADSDADADADTDADGDADADADMTGDLSIVLEETNSGMSDTCSGSMTAAWLDESTLEGTWNCEFAGAMATFGAQDGDITGHTTGEEGAVAGDFIHDGMLGTVEWEGTYTADAVTGGFEVSASEGGFNVVGTGEFTIE